MKKSGYSGIARSTSGRLRRTDREGSSSITSPTLKRSFEVEESDVSINPSPLSRRTNLRSSTSSQRSFHDLGSSRNSDYPSRTSPSDSNPCSPKTNLRRMELSGGVVGGRALDTASTRRTEISIEVSSKQIDSSPSPGIARFGLKRPEAQSLGSRAGVVPESSTSSSSSSAHRRAEISLSRPHEPPGAPRRGDSQPPSATRIPDPPQRRTDPTMASPVEGLTSRRPEMPVFRQPEMAAPPPVRVVENNSHPPAPSGPLPSLVEPRSERTQPPVSETPIVRPIERSEVTTNYSSRAMSEVAVPEMMPPPAVPAVCQAEKPVPGPGMGDFSYVGIDAILEQMRRKAMKQGFELNIMVVGQSGLGKSTLMNTLFKSKVSRKSVQATSQEKIPKTIHIKSVSHDIEEKGVRMKLTVIDTPGFGDQINNDNCWQPIMKFINAQYEQYLQEEININRKKRIPDSRVHCCIYFIPPTGHCLRPLDVEFMRRLSKVVNIVPVIAKADTLTLEERDFFKQKIREELRANGIDVYPQKEFDEDAEDRMINDKIREMIPFAVVGSDQEYQVNGRRLLGRKTKWGTIEVENIAYHVSSLCS
ncbi:septin-9 isoform X5 [Salmo trutta]|uniref:septin-9 isoform X5 n=1 Tax=Salmo trutta TaxID=8032 RepID=UPI001130FA84|nr:septin-9-like isoform X5 [Salmo trutta]